MRGRLGAGGASGGDEALGVGRGVAGERHMPCGVLLLQRRACVQHSDCHVFELATMHAITMRSGKKEARTESVDVELGGVDMDGQPE